MPLVLVPPSYRGPTLGEAEVPVDAGSVRLCVEAVDAKYPGFAAQVFDDAGALYRWVKVFVNEQPVEGDAFDRPIEAGDQVEIVAAISGGA